MTGLERSIAVIGEHARRLGVLLHDAAHPDKKAHPYALHQTPPVVVTVPEDAKVVIEPGLSTTAAREPIQFGEDASTHGGQVAGNTAAGPTAPDLAPTSNS